MNGEPSSLTRILFVDDSKVMLKTASKILSAEFDVVTAVDGEDAWEKLGRDPDIQVLFTDINMPKCDGYALLKKVRTADEQGLHNMPVILVTGADDDETGRQTALDQGATDFLNKRFVNTELLPRARAHAKYERITLQLQAQSTLDPMTGLANETGFLERLEQDIAYARRHRLELTLMRVEIDGLVATYERRGNEVVDQIVVHVANLIRKRIRKEDTAARIGLGGFAISVPGGQLDGVEAMAAYLHDQVAVTALEVDGQRVSISLSTAVISAEMDDLDKCAGGAGSVPGGARSHAPSRPGAVGAAARSDSRSGHRPLRHQCPPAARRSPHLRWKRKHRKKRGPSPYETSRYWITPRATPGRSWRRCNACCRRCGYLAQVSVRGWSVSCRNWLANDCSSSRPSRPPAPDVGLERDGPTMNCTVKCS